MRKRERGRKRERDLQTERETGKIKTERSDSDPVTK